MNIPKDIEQLYAQAEEQRRVASDTINRLSFEALDYYSICCLFGDYPPPTLKIRNVYVRLDDASRMVTFNMKEWPVIAHRVKQLRDYYREESIKIIREWVDRAKKVNADIAR